MENEKGLNIAIIEDDAFYSSILAIQLKNRVVATTSVFSDGEEFLKGDMYAYDVIILDLNLTTEDKVAVNGKNILEMLIDNKAPAKVIVLSSQHVIEDAVEVLKIGAVDYIVKNEGAFDKLVGSIQAIVEFNNLSHSIKDKSEKNFTIKKGLVAKSILLFIIVAISFWMLYHKAF